MKCGNRRQFSPHYVLQGNTIGCIAGISIAYRTKTVSAVALNLNRPAGGLGDQGVALVGEERRFVEVVVVVEQAD